MSKEKQLNPRRDFLKKLSLSLPLLGGVGAGTYAQSKLHKPFLDNIQEYVQLLKFDLMVYGATSAGVIAAYTARMYGMSVLLVEPGRHLGGLSSGGLGSTDTGGQDSYITGLSQEFYLRVGRFYGQAAPAYKFEPHAAEMIFSSYLDEAGVEVLYSRRLRNATVINGKINQVELEYSGKIIGNNIMVQASNFIDATYEGDLMAKAGVSYTVGRESNATYNEKFNGVLPGRIAGTYNKVERTKEWAVNVDPYVVPGKPSSGLLPEINGIGHKPIGTGDKKVQAYCFRLCLTQNRENQIPLQEPEDYDPDRFELLGRLQKLKPWETLKSGMNISMMPNGKTDINNYGLVGFSTNQVGKNFDYPDADYANRERIWQEHVSYQKGFLWFLASSDRVPNHIRKEMNSWGYCRDEFLDTGGWPHQLYIREARRMVSDFVMTEHECIGKRPVSDGIGMGGYALDSHVVQRVVEGDYVQNEGNFFVTGFDPYYIPYRAIIPKKEEISNLIVPVCVSASHAAFGSLRMEPVFMALGQAAGVATYLANKNNQTVQDVDVSLIKKELSQNPLPNRKVPREFKDIIPFKG